MRRAPISLTLLLSLLLISCSGCSRRIKVDIDRGPNPWTHLDLRNDPANFQFAIVSDRNGSCRPGVFIEAVDKLNILQPEFVICVGDLIGGYTEDEVELDHQWDEFDSIVRKLEMPFFYVVGNHDITNEVMVEKWKERLGRSYYHFLYRDVLFLCLNSEDPPRKAEADGLGEEQLAYFQRVLRKNRKVRWTFVFVHKPMWKRNERDVWDGMEAMLKDRDYTVFAGHEHTYEKFVRNGRNFYMLATTGGGSELEGAEAGRFDHVVWITVTGEGPRVANLALDGIFDDNPREERRDREIP